MHSTDANSTAGPTGAQAGDAFSLDDVVTTAQLACRESRPPDYEAENRALVALARELADSPRTILQKLVDTALVLCNADSAGISVLEQAEGGDVFRWRATAGAFALYCGGTLPRRFSPCGIVLDRNATQLMADPSRFYPYITAIKPGIIEVLLIPFHRGPTPIGTVWVVSHTPGKLFQPEDARLVTSLAEFAAAAVEVLSNLTALATANESLQTEALERARAETSRRETDAFHRFAAEAGRTGSWYLRLDTWECVLSPMMAELMGFPHGQSRASAEQWRDTVIPQDRAALEAALAATIERDVPFDVEFRIALSDGTQRWLYSHGGAIRDTAGKAIRLHGASVDVTERKHTDEERLRLLGEVERQSRIFDATLTSITDFAYILDRHARFVYANKPLLRLWGLTLEQAVGKNFLDLNYPEQLAAKLSREVVEVFDTGKCLSDQTAYTSPTGIGGYYEYIFAPVFAADGTVEAVAGSTRDVSRQKRTEEELRRFAAERERLLTSERDARAEAEAANRAKDKFLAVLSHELRTPLSPVAMAIPAMEIDPEMPARFRDDLAMVGRNIGLEVKLIDDLLDLSRVTSGKLRLQMQPVRIHELLHHALHNSLGEPLGKRLNVRQDLRASNDELMADPARLQQVFWNLLRNSVKFTPEDGEITIRTWNKRDNGQLIVEIKDSGVGIPADVLPRIFDAFEQGDARMTRQFGGLGLGLAIAKAVVEMHGGSITAASDGQDQGAVFTVILDTAVAPSAGDVPVEAPHAAGAQPAARPRVLLVEDHLDSARTLARLLKHAGFEVRMAGSAASALQFAATEPFDVVVSDIGLPDATGYELMQQIRDRYGIKGIALSGYGMEDDVRKSREAGFVDHVVKPVNVDYLEAVIRRVTNIV